MRQIQQDSVCNVTVGDSDVASVIGVQGELDSLGATQLRAGFACLLGAEAVVIDIREVPFMDSAGLGALIGGIRRLRESGGAVALCCSRPSLLRLLEMTGLNRILTVTDSYSEATRAVLDARRPALRS